MRNGFVTGSDQIVRRALQGLSSITNLFTDGIDSRAIVPEVVAGTAREADR